MERRHVWAKQVSENKSSLFFTIMLLGPRNPGIWYNLGRKTTQAGEQATVAGSSKLSSARPTPPEEKGFPILRTLQCIC